MTDIKTIYPNRYYASYDTTATQPTIVTGWYNTWAMSDVSNVPKASDMIAMTETEWNDPTFRIPVGKGVKDGIIIDYTPPVVPIPLTSQAQNAMTWVNQQATIATAMGETFTADMKNYVSALRAIINGTDTTSTQLPTQPTDVMN